MGKGELFSTESEIAANCQISPQGDRPVQQRLLLCRGMDWYRNFVQLYAKLQRLTRRGIVYRLRVIRGIVDVVGFRRLMSLELLCTTRLWNTVRSRRIKISHMAQILSWERLVMLLRRSN